MKGHIKPHITEKTLKLVELENKYTFIVDQGLNKIEIAKLVAEIYSVKPRGVQVINVLGKSVVFGRKRIKGKKKDFKKAIVTLKSDDSIDDFNLN